MSSDLRRKKDYGQPLGVDLGALIYEARLPLWLRMVVTGVLGPLVVLSADILIRRWTELDWIGLASFMFCAALLPFGIVDAWVRRVRFFDHGVVVRDWIFRTRAVEYSEVTSIDRGQSLRLLVSKRASINIPKWEGDFDLIEDILKERC